ncbi:MAG: carbohydrate ABC transporter permease, partial [Caulobacteraceae bacterium]
YAVGRWNGFQDALLYISNSKLFPIQMKLYQIVYNNMTLDIAQAEGSATSNLLPESLKAASVMFATIPIIMAYPWLQRYFISGVMIGAIKG